jgi:hypothetical protein
MVGSTSLNENSPLKPLKKGRGGARPGAGMPKGTKTKATISKEQAREALRTIVLDHMDDMVSAQVANSKGIKFLVVREKKSGKFIKRITDPEQEIVLDDEREIAEIWAKDPSVQAFTDLMNRALDKPAEQEQTLNLKMPAMEAVLARLAQGRERVAKRG